MNDVWDEKPRSGPYSPASGMYLSVSIDAWLEKVREEYDELVGDNFVYFSLLNDIKKAMIEWDTRTYEREGHIVTKGYDTVIDTIKEILDNSPFTTKDEDVE